MALSGEAFGNRMCYLEDISHEVEELFFKNLFRMIFFCGIRFVVLI
jgi:hypothetical protein